MNNLFSLIFYGISLGIGLAMDAFSVSLASGLNEPKMKPGKMCAVAGVFAFFQFAMPMIGWVCVFAMAQAFEAFQKYIPVIALLLLLFIGGKMLYEGIRGDNEEEEGAEKVGDGVLSLLIKGVATSIDALSVGFTISEYNLTEALISCAIIAAVTFVICFSGIVIGKKAGTYLAGKAGILGGAILIIIGIEIFVTSLM